MAMTFSPIAPTHTRIRSPTVTLFLDAVHAAVPIELATETWASFVGVIAIGCW